MTNLGDLADLVGAKVHGDRSLRIRGLAPLENAGPDDLSFLAHPRYNHLLQTSRAGAVIASAGTDVPHGVLIEHPDPYRAFATLMTHLHPEPAVAMGVHPSAAVDPTAKVHPDASVGPGSVVMAGAVIDFGAEVGPGAVVGEGVCVGRESRLAAGALVLSGTQVGCRCRIGPGSVVGSAGFGYAPGPDGWEPIPQVGRVILEDDVEIGANTTIDRATLGETVIGQGVKVDNLVQIGHNVVVGRGSVVVAQAGIAGSTRIGERAQIGAQAGIVGHLNFGNDVRLAARAGVHTDIPDGGVRSGAPAVEHSQWLKYVAVLPRLPALLKRIRALERQVEELQELQGTGRGKGKG